MKREINLQESNRAEAFHMWMSSPMPMVTRQPIHRPVLQSNGDVGQVPQGTVQDNSASIIPIPPRSDGWWSCCTLLGHIAEGNAPFVLN